MHFHLTLIRNLEGTVYRENFFVSAIASMLAIRFYLFVTGYPQIGSGEYHIAHMLWGGFLMMVSLILVFTYLNRSTMHIVSILGGIGFGTFIDELGKFITQDNNYFFQPTVAIIYIIFVLIYLSMKVVGSYPRLSDKEYLVNALQLTQDAVTNNLDRDEEKRALAYLKKADPKDPVTKSLKKLLHEVEAIPPPAPGIPLRLLNQFRELYHRVTNWKRIMRFVVIAFLFNAIYIALDTLNVVINHPALTFSEWARLICAIIAGSFVLVGLVVLHRSRLRAYTLFKIGVLVNIFLTQVFVFYQEQFEALIGLSVYIFLLLLLDFGIAREREKAAAVVIKQ